MTPVRQLIESIGLQRDKVIEYQTAMTAIPALGPDNGGTGEMAKARYLEGILRGLGCRDIVHIDAPDPRVPDGVRPNIAARFPGKSSRTLWIMGHMDVVPPGELSQWKTNPWEVTVDGDTIRGRGVEDNQQAITSALLVAGEIHRLGITPDLTLGILLVSDEETGNTYGANYVLKTRPDLFSPEDFVVVPDFGVSDSKSIEISEKGILWIKVTVTGHQCHASRPQEGRNSLVAAADMILHVRDLEVLYPTEDPLFRPSTCTFVPSRHEENVPNVNSLPGQDTFYIDCRILPGISHEDVLESARNIMEAVAERHGVAVELSVVQSAPAAPATSPDSEVIRRISRGIEEVYKVTPHCMGSGGGTVAVGFRQMGIPAAVWSTVTPTYHLANEYGRISWTLGDAQVFAHMLFDHE